MRNTNTPTDDTAEISKEEAYRIISEKLRSAQEQIDNGQCGKWEDLREELLNMIGG